jgi:hypothetical protein
MGRHFAAERKYPQVGKLLGGQVIARKALQGEYQQSKRMRIHHTITTTESWTFIVWAGRVVLNTSDGYSSQTIGPTYLWKTKRYSNRPCWGDGKKKKHARGGNPLATRPWCCQEGVYSWEAKAAIVIPTLIDSSCWKVL